MPDDLKLATLSEADAQHNDEIGLQYQKTKATLDPIMQLIISMLDDDYSYFFLPDIQPSLERLLIASKIDDQKPCQDLGFM